MPITFNSFSPSTKIKSAEINTNFTAIKTLLDGLRPAIHIYVPDALYTTTNVTIRPKIRTDNTLYFSLVDLSVKTAPTGQALIIDINKNGSTIFSTRPQINASATTGGTTAAFAGNGTLVDGDVLSVDIDQVGSTEPGRDLTISLSFYL